MVDCAQDVDLYGWGFKLPTESIRLGSGATRHSAAIAGGMPRDSSLPSGPRDSRAFPTDDVSSSISRWKQQGGHGRGELGCSGAG